VDTALARVARANPRRQFVMLSSLAEGADRLVARRALACLPCELVVALPLPEGEYAKTFTSRRSREEFRRLLARATSVVRLPPRPRRDLAYDAASDYVLRRCDALIAVWDGKAAQGKSGTGNVVAKARRRGLPLAWVRAGNRRPGTTTATSLGRAQGAVTFERFSARRTRARARTLA
jgi:hypothetical protein